jgi:hypothetical protein
MRSSVILFASVLTTLILSSPGAVANPIPVPESDGLPAPEDYQFDILFKSEKVVYTIDDENVAKVKAIYVLQNSANNTTTLNISLPFSYNIPDDVKLSSNAQPVPFTESDHDSNGSSRYSFIFFHLDFAPGETQTLTATYSLRYSSYWDMWEPQTVPGKVYYQHFWCSYIAETGRYWYNNLDTAEFQFWIKKDLYGSGLEGFQINEESGYVVATKKYTNWKPNENIEAKWERQDTGTTLQAHGLIILIIVLSLMLIVLAVVVLRQKKKRKML